MLDLKCFRKCVEIPVLLTFFAYLLSVPITANFIIYRTCYVTLGFNRTECAKLGTSDADNRTAELEELVQPHSNVMSMTQAILTQIVPPILCLLAGPWSDRNGRTPIMIFTFIGFVVRGIVTILVAAFEYTSPWFLLLGSIPAAFLGGLAPFMTVVLCYVTDISTEENRGMRMTIIDGMTAGGMLLGTLCSAYIFAWGGYVLVYSIEMACNILSCLYVYFILTETVVPDTVPAQEFASIFSFNNIKQMFMTTFKDRENYGRALLLIIFVVSTIAMFASIADSSVIFMFLREKFHWDLEHYTLYSAITSLLGIVGTFLGIALMHKLLKITEMPLIILGLCSYFSSSIIQGFAIKDWHIYLAGAVRILYGIASPMCRSLISKQLTREETGKIFAIAVFLDSLVLMVGSPLYTVIYNLTIHTNPGVFNFVTAGLFAINVVLASVMIVLQKRITANAHQYTTLSVNADEE